MKRILLLLTLMLATSFISSQGKSYGHRKPPNPRYEAHLAISW
jgi:hypothetical protein